MKHLKLLSIFILLLFIISCKKDDETGLSPSDFRIKMVVAYENDQCTSKTAYSYIGDRIDSIVDYTNPFNGTFPYFTEAIRYEYEGNIVNATFLTLTGNQAVSGSVDEMEFENNLMVRNNDEIFTYNSGLLVERAFPQGTKSKYEYDNGNLIRITTSRFRASTEEYYFSEKYEFAYIDEQMSISHYSYRTSSEEWIQNGKIDYYFSDDLVYRKDYYESDNITIEYTYEYQYDDKENLIQVIADGRYFNYVNIYDEYDNLIDVEITNTANGDVDRILYYYEVGETNMDQLKVPESPWNLYYNFKKDSDE